MAKRGATQSGGGGGLRRKKDQEMAAYMKAKGVKRTVCSCPICHRTAPLPFNDWSRHRCR